MECRAQSEQGRFLGIRAGVGPGHARSALLQRVVPAETHQFRKPQGDLANLLLHRYEARALEPIETLNIRDRQRSEHLAIGSKIVSKAVSVSRDKVPTLEPKVNGPGLSTCDTTMVRPSLRGGESSAVRKLISWVRTPGTATLLAPGAAKMHLIVAPEPAGAGAAPARPRTLKRTRAGMQRPRACTPTVPGR